jgi:hypothetical protein
MCARKSERRNEHVSNLSADHSDFDKMALGRRKLYVSMF